MAKIALLGEPIIHDRSLMILREKFGPRKGFEVFKGALALKHLGWLGLKRICDRSTILRLRRDLIAAGLLSGVYEDDISMDEMLRQCI